MGTPLLPGKNQPPPYSLHFDIALLLLMGSTIFYYLSLLTFHPFDHSFISVQVPRPAPQNAAGVFGAYVSSIALYYLGLTAILLPVPALLYALFKTFCQRPSRLGRAMLGSLLFLSSGAFLLESLWPVFLVGDFPFAGGGLLGKKLCAQMRFLLGEQGSLIVVLTLAPISFCLLTHLSFFQPFLRGAGRHLSLWLLKPPKELLVFLRSRCPSLAWPPLLLRLKTRALETMPATAPSCFPPEPLVYDDRSRGDRPSPLAAREGFDHHTKQPEIHSLFTPSPSPTVVQSQEVLTIQEELLQALNDFKISGTIVDCQQGPLVSTHAFKPDKGIKQATIANLMNDLALALKLESLFLHPIPEKSAVGFQIPNRQREIVRFADFIHAHALSNAPGPLPLALGKNVYGDLVCEDLSDMPHLLIAGSTGSGKSVGIHSFLCSLLLTSPPAQLRLLLIDPKMLELTYYEGLAHLLMPVLTDPQKAVEALAWAVTEMDRRYQIMQAAKVRHIADFNRFWLEASPEQKQALAQSTACDSLGPLPYLVIVIDELADLMMTASKDMEGMIARLAQKARASGMHMILATQRPSVDVLTGTIKANLPSRLTYRLVSSHDSRTIIDQTGAEKLLGKGDLLFQKPGAQRLLRLHGAFITDQEIKNLVNHLHHLYGRETLKFEASLP